MRSAIRGSTTEVCWQRETPEILEEIREDDSRRKILGLD